MDELKPCPFCGGKAYYSYNQDYAGGPLNFFVGCDCGVQIDQDWCDIGSKEALFRAWNRRADHGTD